MKNRSKGFTLIELLVVIAIIAILAAILFPVFASAKEKARSSQCLSNMNQLGKAMRMYLDAHDSKFPNACPLGNLAGTRDSSYYYQGTGVSGENGTNQFNIYERGGLWPFVSGKGVYVCPSDFNQHLPRPSFNTSASAKTKREFGLSYSMNFFLPLTLDSDVKSPSKTVLFVDEGIGSFQGENVYPIVDGNFGPDIDWPTKIHGSGTNYAFIDGHSEWVKMSADGYGELIWRTNADNTAYRINTNSPEFQKACASSNVRKRR